MHFVVVTIYKESKISLLWNKYNSKIIQVIVTLSSQTFDASL